MSGETEANISGWTVDTLHAHFQGQLDEARLGARRQMDDLRSMLQERYATQTKAIDAAFLAQQTAMQTAFTAADRAVQAALDAAKEAVIKAETATEKRFEGVNEFRQQLADQAATFMPRTEGAVLFERYSADIGELKDRVSKIESRTAAIAEERTTQRLDTGQLIAIIVAVVVVLSAAAAFVGTH